MGKPKGKTPSLISMSTGKPAVHTCGRATECDRCSHGVATGATCFHIPKMKNGFTSKPIFCLTCTADIIAQTKIDLQALEATLTVCS
jgi:hypothetical protein